jgi:hypothetical protein
MGMKKKSAEGKPRSARCYSSWRESVKKRGRNNLELMDYFKKRKRKLNFF